MTFNVELLPGGILPVKAYATDAGYDCFANEDITIYIGKTAKVRLGFKIGLKPGWEAQLRGRSGLGLKGITIAQGIGTIDAGYRDEMCALLRNHGDAPFHVVTGMKLCQIVLTRVEDTELQEGPLDVTERGLNGFGSTGT